MKSEKKYLKNKINYVKYIPFAIFIMVLLLTIGYSAFSDNLSVNGATAVVLTQSDIRITGANYKSATKGGISNSTGFGNKSVSLDFDLPNSGSTITYNVTILNLGNVEMAITNITGVSTKLIYTLNNISFKDPLCDDTFNSKCKLGSVTTISITFAYKNYGSYNANSTNFALDLEFQFDPVVWVAQIGNRQFGSLQTAINTVPANNTEVTIDILANVTERLKVEAGQSIYFNIGNYTLFAEQAAPVIESWGAIRINNGTISSNTTQGAINVHDTGSFIMSGGNIIATGTRQALYNNGGSVTISGNAYLSATTSERGTVHNLNNGNLTILGGTIISQNFSAVTHDSGTLTLGEKDGTFDTTTPVLRGKIYGIKNYNDTNQAVTNFNFYDGVIMGRTGTVYDDTGIVDLENGYSVMYQSQTIDEYEYQKAFCSIISNIVVVRFDFNDGTGDVSIRNVESGTSIGTPPNRTRTGYIFDGWYKTDGVTEIDGNTIVDEDTTFVAHWVLTSEYYVARIGDNYYLTFAAAISAVTNSTPTTIYLIRNTTGNVTINSGRNITLDFGNKTLSGVGDPAVITNKGNCTFVSGTIATTSMKTSAINNETGGNFTMTGGSVQATGERQAIYNNGGTVTISGSAYLYATAPERATVHNFKAGGTITITGGTILSQNFSAINNAAGTLTIGVSGGGINTSTPIIRGSTYGVQNSATFNFYDGTLYGKTKGYNGNATCEVNSTVVNTTEVIDGVTYKKTYLE